MTRLLIGTSGWSYDHWAERFYPAELSKDRWLEYYQTRFATVEINNSFYRLPSESAFGNWFSSVADDFTFSVKASRYITHMKKLNDPAESSELFLNRARLLKNKLGPVLFQLPPQLQVKLDKLENILSILPDDLRYCFEFRHTSWFCEEVYDLLGQHNAALCIADSPDFPLVIQQTADFGYFRLHGATSLYRSRYSSEELEGWKNHIDGMLNKGSDVYVYFDNDAEAFAVENALELAEILSHREELHTPSAEYPEQQSLL